MEIKVVDEVVHTRKVYKYVAFDGKEFDNAYSCKNYEYETFRKMLEERNDIEYSDKIDGYAPLDCECVYDDGGYEWYKPLTKEAVDFINKAYNTDTVNGVSYSCIGEWVCFEDDSDGGSYPYFFEDSIIAAKDFFKAFGYNMILEEIKDEE